MGRPETLYKKLEDHFNRASAKYPQWAATFKEQLGYYKMFLNGTAPQGIPEGVLDIGSLSARPEEMAEVLRSAYKIYKGHKGQKI